MTVMLRELYHFLRELNSNVELSGEELRISYDEVPVWLIVKPANSGIYVSLRLGEDLRSYLEEAAWSDQNIEEVVNEVLEYFSEVALRIRKWGEKRNIVTVFNLHENIVRIQEIVEDIVEDISGE